jgi:hypothetical protein
LHRGLTHGHYSVDFVDDFGVATGALRRFAYSALYVTAPNLSTNAQAAVLDWVAEGGTLALLPGACAADEYNESAAVISQAMGAAWGSVERVPMPIYVGLGTQVVIAVTDSRLGTTGDVTRLQIAPLTLTGAGALANFQDGRIAVAEKAYGAGRILTYAYWPGGTYLQSPDTFEKYKLPVRWSAATRALLTAPARIAGAVKPVEVSAEVVEALLLESGAGTAITLLNWTGSPFGQVAVTIPISESMAAALNRKTFDARSVQQGPLGYASDGTNVTFALPLQTVDVLLLNTELQRGTLFNQH